MTRKSLYLIVSLALLSAGSAGGTDSAGPRAEAEVDHLLVHLESSGCEFYRNGKWYAPGEARSHLEQKRDYLAKRSRISSAEDFIDRAATRSSMSGEAYLVRCAPEEPVPSGVWLHQELDRFRAETPATSH